MHRLNVRVYYEDVDLAGVVYYANYLRFYERGRTEALRAFGVDQMKMRDAEKLVFVVTRLNCDFLGPARFNDLLEIQTEITAVRSASLDIAQAVLCQDAVLNRAKVTCACMDVSQSAGGRPARLPEELRTRLARSAAA
ncbi:MAG: tol-pal system-associated acyl-CoA thioesterase [Pseudomonadota bacterium]